MIHPRVKISRETECAWRRESHTKTNFFRFFQSSQKKKIHFRHRHRNPALSVRNDLSPSLKVALFTLNSFRAIGTCRPTSGAVPPFVQKCEKRETGEHDPSTNVARTSCLFNSFYIKGGRLSRLIINPHYLSVSLSLSLSCSLVLFLLGRSKQRSCECSSNHPPSRRQTPVCSNSRVQ